MSLKYCILDTETTGLDADYHEVIQIAAMMCDENMEHLAGKSFKIRPRWIERASKKALEINRYNPRTWNPKYFSHADALKDLNAFVKSNIDEGDKVVLIGQNIGFDIKFLLYEYKRNDIPYPFEGPSIDLIDIVKIWERATGIKLKSRSLTNLSEYTGCVNKNAHDAYSDIVCTLDVLLWFANDLKTRERSNERQQ